MRLAGARLLGELDLSGVKLRCPLELLDCSVGGDLLLARAEAPALSLAGSHLSGRFLGRQLTVTHTLDLSAGFRCDCALDSTAPASAARWICRRRGSRVDDVAFSAEGIRVDEDLSFCGTRCSGSVQLAAADVGGTLDFTEAVLGGGDGVALSAEGLVVGKNLFTRRVRCPGEFSVFGARVSGQLTCTGGVFRHPGGVAFNGEQLDVGSYMFLRRVKCVGQVRLFGARVGAQLDCERARFKNPDAVAYW